MPPPLLPSLSSTPSWEEFNAAVNGYEAKEHSAEPSTTQEEKASYEVLSRIELPPLTCPKSAYSGYRAPLPKSQERDVVNSLCRGAANPELVLDGFVVYSDVVTGTRQPGLVSLHNVATKLGNSTFFFDALVRNAENPESEPYYLERISFTLVSIGGYENVDQHMVGDDLWIQSTHCRARGDSIWYRLGQPAEEYRRYHQLFVWVANLSKHVVDYLNNHARVMLNDFKSEFADWLGSHHGNDPDFTHWLTEYGKKDFREAIVVYSDFLLKQACDIDASYLHHPLWSEIGRASTNQILKIQPRGTTHTVVTPYVYQCFRKMPWSNHLKAVDFNAQSKQLYQRRLEEMKFVGSRGRKVTVKSIFATGPVSCGSFTVSPGDVVATVKDQNSIWRGEGEEVWYAFVQDIQTYKNRTRLYVIWLYRPTDTVCANMTYPYQKELFLSDHCNCEDGHFDITQVVRKVRVNFFSDQEVGGAEFFVRQTYNSEDDTFTTLKQADFCCSHRRQPSPRTFSPGDTVLVEFGLRLEPAEIIKFEGNKVEIRQLLRRNRDFCDASSRPNELVYTNRFCTVNIEQINRRCHIRFYSADDLRNGYIPAPYCRDGNGDAFYITVRETPDGCLESAQAPEQFKQGFDPLKSRPLLRALNIFSGGGNFDRGLEEGGAIRSEWAVEWGVEQMLTYRANHAEPDRLKLYCGSVNDYLIKALHGNGDELIAKIGQVQFLSAGSPCQGYSMVNPNKMNEASMRNSSMVASVAAFVDLYRPQYAILENVPAMANKRHKQNPLSQLVCAFVGMGYQVRILNLDAWSFGAPQSRSRLFVMIAAPGLQLPDHPPLTHSHPRKTPRRSLGEAPNGLPFGNRQFDIPVFDFVSASHGTRDLPLIGKGHIAPICEPDHRSSRTESTVTQNIINSIPKFPKSMGLQDALRRGWIQSTQGDSTVRNLKDTSTNKSWSRVDPDHLISTITTSQGPSCRFTGRWLHWSEDRLITIKEARRAQGFPDSEVIIGTPAQRWTIIGNSVARQVALALGLVIREACLKNLDHSETGCDSGQTQSEDNLTMTEKLKSRVVTVTKSTTTTTTTMTTTMTTTFMQYNFLTDQQDPSNSETSPDPLLGFPRKRGIQVLDKVLISAPPPSKKSKP
ncbi:hypothetical protein VTO42DRAFT_2788 [Malbranchea cinnamomea]